MVSQLFLGIRLECAKCHHHPFEVWGQDDFYGFAAYFARVSDATEAAVRGDLERLPALLEHVERLVKADTIGAEPNAADFQIGTTARLLYAFEDLRSTLEGTLAAALGMRVLPDFPHRVPPFLPEPWLHPVRPA